MKVETFHMGYEWEMLMMRLEEAAWSELDAQLNTGFELDTMHDLHRRIERVMDAGLFYGRRAEERLRAHILAKQDEWERVWREVAACAFSL
jgi:hypothetical protein